MKMQDQGYAWAICAGAFWFQFVQGGFFKSYGILYLEFLDLFGEGPTKTSLMGLVSGICEITFSIVGGKLGAGRYARPVVIVASILTSGLCVATGYAPSLDVAIVTFGMMGGTLSLIFPAVFGSVSKYFIKKRYLAYGIATAGGSVGSLVCPVLITLMIEIYTFRGAMVILAGIVGQGCVCGALLIPLNDEHTLATNSNSLGETKGEKNEQSLFTSVKCIKGSSQIEQVVFETPNKSSSEINKDDNEQSPFTSTQSVNHSSESEEGDCELENTDIDLNSKQSGGITGHKIPKKYQILSYKQLLSNPEVLSLTLVCFLCFIGSYGVVMLIPPVAREIGLDRLTASSMLLSFSIVELVARPSIGWISDRSEVIKKIIFPSIQLMVGTGYVILSFLPHITSVAMLGILAGFGTSFFSFMIPLYSESVGAENSVKAGGLLKLAAGLYFMTITSVIGAFKEEFDSFLPSVTMCGCCSILASLIVILTAIIKHKKQNVTH